MKIDFRKRLELLADTHGWTDSIREKAIATYDKFCSIGYAPEHILFYILRALGEGRDIEIILQFLDNTLEKHKDDEAPVFSIGCALLFSLR